MPFCICCTLSTGSIRYLMLSLYIINHHHHRVARPSVSIAISTSWRYFERSCTRFHAVLRPTLWGRRSSSIVRSHVRLGRPARRCQSTGGRLMSARRMRERWVVLRWVDSRKMSKQTKSSLCDNWGDSVTFCTPHFFVGDMRRIWNLYYMAKTPLVKSIETSTGGHIRLSVLL